MRYIVTLICTAIVLSSYGGIETYSSRTNSLNVNDEVEVYDAKYFDMEINPLWNLDYTNFNVKNGIRIGYRKDAIPQLSESADITIDVTSWEYSTTLNTFVQVTDSRTLSVYFDQDGTLIMDDQSTFIFENGHRVLAKIDAISGNASNLYLETFIEVERYYTFDNSPMVNIGFNPYNYTNGSSGLEPTADPVSGLYNPRIEFWWEEIYGAEWYDLEWTFISDVDYDIATQTVQELAEANMNFDFYKNSTRVRVRNNYYEIPGIFNKGHIVYRVRAVGKEDTNFEYNIEGPWSFNESGSVADFNNLTANGSIEIGKDFEEGMNWAYSVSYTENGKRQEGISYLDGVSRSRQALARNNVAEKVIISNTYFDEIGRPIISDLPTPDADENLSFRQDFNYVIGTSGEEPITSTNISDINICSIGLEFSNNYGAGQYYSTSNSNTDGENANIPDANGFPYVRMTYTADPTYRLREQGLAGEQLQVGNNANKFYYETPNQEELNELFGTEVGWESHYQKEYAIDPNGQAYIKYYDMAGRVVASGLSGDAPTSLESLSNNTGGGSETTTVYTSVKDNNIDPTIAEYSFSKIMLKNGSYKLLHTFDPAVFQDPTCINGICFDCHYDFEITIERTDCPQPTPAYYNSVPINGSTIDLACNVDPYLNGTFIDITLDAGEYVITKSLKISDGIAEQYWCEYVENSTCLPDYNTIYNALYDETDFGCTPLNLQLTAETECDRKRQMMILDMSVGGQYGEVYDANGNIVTNIQTSIYNVNNVLPSGYSWRDPVTPYMNNDGTPARIYLTELTPGNYSPTPMTGATIYYEQGNPYILPEELNSLSDFVQSAQLNWGASLLDYHPEACYLEFCETYGYEYHNYTDELNEIETFDQACAGGYFAPLGTTSTSIPAYSGCTMNPTIEDDFFTTGYFTGSVAQWSETNYTCIPVLDYSAGSALDDYYLLPDGINYLNIWEYAVWQAVCGQETVYSDILTCVNNTTLDDCTEDLVWMNFRDAYLQLRQQTYLFAQASYVSYPSQYVGGGDGQTTCELSNNQCIGFEDFYGSSFSVLSGIDCFDPYNYYNTNVPGSPISVPAGTDSKPCDNVDGDLFDNKMPRFLNFYNETRLQVPAAFSSDPEQYVEDQIASVCEQSCTIQAEDWMEALAGCNLTQQQYDDIKAGLIEVCSAGCDVSNMTGASDLTNAPNPNTGAPNYYTSFEDVLVDVLGSNYESALCSDLLISSPYPYGQNFQQSTTSDLDECGCDMIMQANYDLTNNPVVGVTTLEEMIAYNEGVNLTTAKMLLCKCTEAFDGTWSPGATWNSTSIANLAVEPVLVPSNLSCNPQSCETCTSVDNSYNSFITEFGSGVVNQPTYEVLMTNYLNIDLGFNLNYSDYDFFMEACDANSGNPTCQLTSLAPLFENMIDVLARRGQLTSTAAVSLTDNVVYQYSEIGTILNSSTYSSSITSNVLTMTFGSNNVDLNLPSNPDFTFDDILSLDNLNAEPCGSNDAFTIEATIMVCGLPEIRTLTGSSADLDLVVCYCGSTSPELCNYNSLIVSNDPCYIDQLLVLNDFALESYFDALADEKETFIANYTSTCAAAFATEEMEETSDRNDYQFTLYYYDQAGNLVQTIPPAGVDVTFKNSASFPTVDFDRDQGISSNVPSHTYNTKYAFNSYNSIVSTEHPDQNGTTLFWYDRYGRLVASQNPVQTGEDKYSYIFFDIQGRPIESGQVAIDPSTPLTEAILKADDLGASFEAWVNTGTKSEINITQFDVSLGTSYDALFESGIQENLRLRVASTLYYPIDGQPYESAIHYSYDEHGNVIEQIQDVPMMAPVLQDQKSTQYDFELISGNVTEVRYQKGAIDAITHQYYFDEMNRLEEVHTTTDNVHSTREAHYRYYDDGQIARVEIGDYQVQGKDYAYTINGWYKGLNSSSLNSSRDMGKDGITGYYAANANAHELFAKDITAYTLGYFDGDYSAIGMSTMEMTYTGADAFNTNAANLYNGNIRNIVTSIYGINNPGTQINTFGTTYRYDQLNRFKEMKAYYKTTSSNDWTGVLASVDFYNANVYDANGNIQFLKRNPINEGGLGYMDDFAYSYNAGTNQLNYVTDNALNDGVGDDIVAGQLSNNYTYNAIGELISDAQENIGTIEWRRSDRKIKKITRSDLGSPEVEFIYDPNGMRVVKIVKPRSNGILTHPSNWEYTYYTYDASGQAMAIYDARLSTTHNEATLEENNIYGATRIGQYSPGKLLYYDQEINYGNLDVMVNTLGMRNYELTNHQGNVNAVIRDRKVVATPGGGTIYDAVVIMQSDYYPYGMQMKGRSISSPAYRYGYQGQEKDDEIKALEGSSLNYKFRMHDPRLGRFFAIDPLTQKYPWYTPYQFGGNKVISMVELEGLEEAPAQIEGRSANEVSRAESRENPIKIVPRDYWTSYDNFEVCGAYYDDVYWMPHNLVYSNDNWILHFETSWNWSHPYEEDVYIWNPERQEWLFAEEISLREFYEANGGYVHMGPEHETYKALLQMKADGKKLTWDQETAITRYEAGKPIDWEHQQIYYQAYGLSEQATLFITVMDATEVVRGDPDMSGIKKLPGKRNIDVVHNKPTGANRPLTLWDHWRNQNTKNGIHYTKEKYGSSEAAEKARKQAFAEWKESMGYN